MLEFFGRLHPLMLHLPIGILALAFLMQLTNKEALKPAIGFALLWGFATAVVTAMSGYFLAKEGGYADNLLGWHKWLAIATTCLSGVVWWLFKQQSKAFLPAFTASMALLLVTGHLGGTLTHGEGFLTEPFQQETPAAAINLDSAQVFHDFIQPIINEKCTGCHNESKLKGELLMTTQEGLTIGGKTGALFTPGNVGNSLMFKRIRLPHEEKKHMPPKGKKQLTDEEILLLEWWVNSGANFEKALSQVETPDSIMAILEKYASPQKDEGVFALEVPPASESKLENIREAGFMVTPISLESPFLDIVFPKNKVLDKAILKKLKGAAKQIVRLDLSGSALDDDMLSVIRGLPHLSKLYLQQTKITDDGMDHLKGLDFLEYLNAFGTQITDEGLRQLEGLPRLRQLYLWQTNTTPSGIADLQSKAPHLRIDQGVDKEIFGDATLLPPVIAAEKDIFQDSLLVELQLNFKAADIYYTLDGSNPDSTSLKYEKPILLRSTAEVKAFAHKAGWESSAIASKIFPMAKYKAKSISLAVQPNEKYKGNGAATLVDFERGTESFADGKWLGFQKHHAEIFIDLGKIEELSRITVGVMEATSSWIFYPKGLELSVSENGDKYQQVIKNTYPTARAIAEPEQSNLSETFEPTQARYLKLKVLSNVVNPEWHPSAGEPCWIFLDEVVVE